MIEQFLRGWRSIWFAPGAKVSFVAARIILAAHSLWILGSHLTLPTLVAWPAAFWKPISRRLLFRFGYFTLSPQLESVLFVLLLCCLVAVVFGFALRVTALAAGLLLYHFAPLDSLLAHGDFVGMGGLTVPTLGILAIWAAGETADEGGVGYRWPVVLTQLLLALSFLLSGISKLMIVGWHWYHASSIQEAALTGWSMSARPAALWIASNPSLAWGVAIGSAALDSMFIFAVFSRRIRWIVLPLALMALVVRSAAFGLHWLAAPLLLLFIDWDAVVSRYSGWKNPAIAQRA